MKTLKITAAGWENYTGTLGMVEFKDGVSVDPVPLILSNRISATISMVTVDAEGVETPTGVANDLLNGGVIVAAVEELQGMSEEDIKAEQEYMKRINESVKVEKFYSVEELETIADEKGLKGLREIGNLWNVRERAIPYLIEKIMSAQRDYQEHINSDKMMEKLVVTTGEEELEKSVIWTPVLKTEEQALAIEKEAQEKLAVDLSNETPVTDETSVETPVVNTEIKETDSEVKPEADAITEEKPKEASE